MQFRKRKGGKAYPITPATGKKTIFHAPKDKRIAKIIRAGSPQEAELSVKELEAKFDKAKTRNEQERIWRATQEEANRAEIGSTNPNYGPEAQERSRKVEQIYRNSASKMHDRLFLNPKKDDMKFQRRLAKIRKSEN